MLRFISPLLLVFASLTQAADMRIAVIYDADQDVFSQYVAHLVEHSRNQSIVIDSLRLDAAQTLPAGGTDYQLVITVGSEAFNFYATSAWHRPMLAVMLSRAAFETQLTTLRKSAIPVSAIYQDPPPGRQMDLAKLLLPRASTLAYLYAADDQANKAQVLAAADARHMQIQAQLVEQADTIPSALVHIVGNAEYLLASSNADIYNRSTIKNILTMSYRNGCVLIGSSPAFVKAGSLATTYSSAQQIADQTLELLQALRTLDIHLPPPAYARYFSVALNADVARSLSIPLPPIATLEQALALKNGVSP